MVRRRSRAGVVSLVAIAVVVAFPLVGGSAEPNPALSLAFGAVALVAAAWAVVQSRRDRAAYERALQARAVADERLVIARDLHDIVSHRLATITMRAAVARRRGEPAELAAALGDIEEASRATTTELRRMLILLRGDQPAPVTPVPGIGAIPALVADSGLRVTLKPEGVDPHSDGASVTAYRIVQECLANTARHAGPTSVEVRLSRAGDDLRVSVVDAGPQGGWVPQPGSGHGLAAVAERVAALGGTVTWGRRGFGFAVDAVLPDPIEARR